MALMSRLTQSIYLCFGFFFSQVCIPTWSWSLLLTCPNQLRLPFLHLSVMFSTSSLSLMLAFLTRSLSVWPFYINILFSSLSLPLSSGPSIRNAVWIGRVSGFLEKSIMKMYGSSLLSLLGGWGWGVLNFQQKSVI